MKISCRTALGLGILLFFFSSAGMAQSYPQKNTAPTHPIAKHIPPPIKTL
ncbi:hypothetical protein [Chitinophaga sp. MD30]|nr:hypothetical protein [Chitinophaga sp. MD30]